MNRTEAIASYRASRDLYLEVCGPVYGWTAADFSREVRDAVTHPSNPSPTVGDWANAAANTVTWHCDALGFWKGSDEGKLDDSGHIRMGSRLQD